MTLGCTQLEPGGFRDMRIASALKLKIIDYYTEMPETDWSSIFLEIHESEKKKWSTIMPFKRQAKMRIRRIPGEPFLEPGDRILERSTVWSALASIEPNTIKAFVEVL